MAEGLLAAVLGKMLLDGAGDHRNLMLEEGFVVGVASGPGRAVGLIQFARLAQLVGQH